jgi:hypothetical protein
MPVRLSVSRFILLYVNPITVVKHFVRSQQDTHSLIVIVCIVADKIIQNLNTDLGFLNFDEG